MELAALRSNSTLGILGFLPCARLLCNGLLYARMGRTQKQRHMILRDKTVMLSEKAALLISLDTYEMLGARYQNYQIYLSNEASKGAHGQQTTTGRPHLQNAVPEHQSTQVSQ